MEKKAYLSIIAAACLWGGIGVFVKVLTAVGLTSLQGVAARNLVASVAFFLYLLVTDPKALRIHPRHWYYFFGSGVCGLLFFNWCYFTVIAQSSMSVAAVLLYTSPVFVMILSTVLFRERITPVKLIALLITFVGCTLATGLLPLGETRLSGLTILTGLGAGFGYALYSVLSKVALRQYSASTVTFYTILFCAVLAVPLLRTVPAGGFAAQSHLLGRLPGHRLSVLCHSFLSLYQRTGPRRGRKSLHPRLPPSRW